MALPYVKMVVRSLRKARLSGGHAVLQELLKQPCADIAVALWVKHLSEAHRINVGVLEAAFIRIAALKLAIMELASNE